MMENPVPIDRRPDPDPDLTDRPRNDAGRPGESFLPPYFTTLLGVLLAIIIAILAWQLGERPGPFPDPQTPVLRRVDYADMVRVAGPFAAQYQKLLPPFHVLEPYMARPNRPKESLFKLQRPELMAAGGGGIECGPPDPQPADPTMDVYQTVGKLVSSLRTCTGTMVGPTVMLTADHCLPWDSPKSVWQSMQFFPAFDAGAASPPKFANVKQCIGINPPQEDGRDMAACELTWSIGSVIAHSECPEPGDDFDAWYTGGGSERWWGSLGYPQVPGGGGTMQVEYFTIPPGNVQRDDRPDHNCSLLETCYFADSGWSGGPAFTERGDKMELGAVVFDCIGQGEGCLLTRLNGGGRLGTLTTYALLKLEPALGFVRSPE